MKPSDLPAFGQFFNAERLRTEAARAASHFQTVAARRGNLSGVPAFLLAVDALRDAVAAIVAVWMGRPTGLKVAVLGDSIAASNSSATSGTEGNGFLSHALRACGQRLKFDHTRNFGVGGDTSVMSEARLAAMAAAGTDLCVVHVGTNDRGSAALTATQTMDSLIRIRDFCLAAEITVIFMVPPPRGNATYADKILSAPQLANHKEVRQRLLAEFTQTGVGVVDTWPLLAVDLAVGDLNVAYTTDGLHPNVLGAYYWAVPLATKITAMADPTNDIGVAASATIITSNWALAGTAGSPGTGGSGEMADGYSGANATGTTGVTRTYSKVTVGGKLWQQIVVGGIAATSAASIDLMRQISLHTLVVPGDTYEVVGEYEVDAGTTNVLSLQAGWQTLGGATPLSIWDQDRYQDGALYPAIAQSGQFRSPPLVMPADATDLRMRISAYLSTAGAPSMTLRVRALELRKVV
jgi:lysophospholipase L1-like esterase